MTGAAQPGSMDQPLRGTLVLDASRMLPGAVLARMLIDLGARLIKIEEPLHGDPLRNAPPLIDGVGAGFCAFYRGAESIGLDLRRAEDAARLRKLCRHADVLVESFRPGSMEAWGVGPERLQEINPALVICMLSGFGSRGADAVRVGHDLNFVALSGMLSLFPKDEVPQLQFADVSAGMLACTAVLGGLLRRTRTRRGVCIDQPLSGGPFPFLALRMAEEAAGGGGVSESLLSGRCPAYRLYRCGDGMAIALGALEPKFWDAFVDMLGLDDLAGLGLEGGPQGESVGRRVEQRLADEPRERWLELSAERGLPVTSVNQFADVDLPGPFIPSLGRTPTRPAPRLGQHAEDLSREFGLAVF